MARKPATAIAAAAIPANKPVLLFSELLAAGEGAEGLAAVGLVALGSEWGEAAAELLAAGAGAPAAGVGAFCSNACADSSFDLSKTVVFSSSSSHALSAGSGGARGLESAAGVFGAGGATDLGGNGA